MIVSSVIKFISPGTTRDYVIEDHTFDDGTVVRIEGLRDNGTDHEAAMLARVPQLEADHDAKVAEEAEEAVLASAEAKVTEHVKGLNLKTIGLTDAEVEALAKQNYKAKGDYKVNK